MPFEEGGQRGAFHHIAQHNLVKETIAFSKDKLTNEEFKEEKKEKIGNYLNTPHIKNIIVQHNFIDRRTENDNPPPGKPPIEHGRLINAAVSHNPNNYVYGPSPDVRADDPKGHFDHPLNNKQTPEFKETTVQFVSEPNLENLAKIKPALPVEFEKRGNDRKPYFVKN
jgi:hypothetical protein